MTNKTIDELMAKNKEWAAEQLAEDPNYFSDISKGQSPKCMWIGCADSRLSAEHLLKARPGEFFVQRNVANMVCHSDLNVITALAYAVDVLKVENIIVCGHSNCGGCGASFEKHAGIVDNWLQHLRIIILQHQKELNLIEDPLEKANRLAEINTLHQLRSLANTTVIQQAWTKGQSVMLHPWFYDMEKGTVRPLADSITGQEETLALERKLFG
jgi:carbonic anhydrase